MRSRQLIHCIKVTRKKTGYITVRKFISRYCPREFEYVAGVARAAGLGLDDNFDWGPSNPNGRELFINIVKKILSVENSTNVSKRYLSAVYDALYFGAEPPLHKSKAATNKYASVTVKSVDNTHNLRK